MSTKFIGFYTATSIVIANMIGTGVFTSLGFQIMGIHSGFSLLFLWIIGGIISLCGALSYSELAACMPRSGSEYHYLSRIYHPAVGFLSGWISATVGFAAPVALAAMAMGGYVSKIYPEVNPLLIASSVVILLTVIHSLSIKTGSIVQNIFTSLKIILILFIIVSGFITATHETISFSPSGSSFKEVVSPAFAISLFWVSYSYSGWNASAYIAGEIDNPQKNVPKSLFTGTLFVTILYILLNFIFLYCAPMNEMAGQKEVGYIAAKHIFGTYGGNIIGLIIATLLVSSVSSMIIAGPRVSQMMGEDNSLLTFFSKKNSKGIPFVSIIIQAVISLVMIFTSGFEQVLIYVGFTLTIFTFMTVLGLFILRIRKPHLPRPYKTWGYPITPAIFLIVTLWILCYGFYVKRQESLIGLATAASGLFIYYLGKKNANLPKHADTI